MHINSSPRRPNVEFIRRRMPDEKRPFVAFSGDAGEWKFHRTASLQVPSMLNLLATSNGHYCDLMIDVRSGFFPANRNVVWDVTISIDGKVLGTPKFWKQYAAHQVIIPIARFCHDNTVVQIEAKPVGETDNLAQHPVFALDVILCDKDYIWEELGKRSIWLFSTARSGSTWLANDIIGWRHRARLMDESGLGRMFAPTDWDVERFFAVEETDMAAGNGSAGGDGEPRRTANAPPPFERAFRNTQREQQILNHINFDLFHKLLRDCALEQVLNEWGVRHYQHLVFKMPNDSHAADYIMRAFPESRMIFLMRDGRDVMRSRFSPFASQRLASTKNQALRLYAIAFYAHFWNFEIEIIQAAFDAHCPDLRYFLRYEDIRRDPKPHIEKLLAAMRMTVPSEELAALVNDVTLENMPAETRGPDKPRQDGKIGGYRGSFNQREIDLMNSIMGKNLKHFGYDVDEPAAHRPTGSDVPAGS